METISNSSKCSQPVWKKKRKDSASDQLPTNQPLPWDGSACGGTLVTSSQKSKADRSSSRGSYLAPYGEKVSICLILVQLYSYSSKAFGDPRQCLGSNNGIIPNKARLNIDTENLYWSSRPIWSRHTVAIWSGITAAKLTCMVFLIEYSSTRKNWGKLSLPQDVLLPVQLESGILFQVAFLIIYSTSYQREQANHNPSFRPKFSSNTISFWNENNIS